MANTVKENWKALKSAITTAIKDHVPQKQLSGWWNLPYMTRDLKRKIRTKARRYKKANRTGKTEDWKKFKDLGNALQKNL